MTKVYSTSELMQDDFEPIVNRTLNFEGGVTTDTGGLTNRGITQTLFDSYNKQRNKKTKDVRLLTDTEVKEVYYDEFYKRPKIDMLPDGVKDLIFDYGVQSSPRRAIKSLQNIVGSESDGIIGNNTLNAVDKYMEQNDEKTLMQNIIDERESFIKKTPAYKKTPEGLMNRLNSLRKEFNLSSLNPFSATEAEASDIFTTGQLMSEAAADDTTRPSKAATGTIFTTEQLMKMEDFTQDLTLGQKIMTSKPVEKVFDAGNFVMEAITKPIARGIQQVPAMAENVVQSTLDNVRGLASRELAKQGAVFGISKEEFERRTPEQQERINKANQVVEKTNKLIQQSERLQQQWIDSAQQGWEAADQKIFQGNFMENPSWTRAIAMGFESAPLLLMAGAVTAATKSPLAGAAAIGGLQAAEEQVAARKAGKSLKNANTIMLVDAIALSALESIPLTGFMKGGVLPLRMFRGAIQEGSEEVLQDLWVNSVAKIGYDETRNLTENLVESFIGGAVSGGLLGATSPASGISKNIENAESKGVNVGAMQEAVATQVIDNAQIIKDLADVQIDKFKQSQELEKVEPRRVGGEQVLTEEGEPMTVGMEDDMAKAITTEKPSKASVKTEFENANDPELLNYLSRYIEPKQVAALTGEERLSAGNMSSEDFRDFVYEKNKQSEEGKRKLAEIIIEEETKEPAVIPDETPEYQAWLERNYPLSEQRKEYDVPLHPAEDARAALEKLKVKDFSEDEMRAVKEIISYTVGAQKGGQLFKTDDNKYWKIKSGNLKSVVDIGGPKEAFKILDKVTSGKTLTPLQMSKLKNMLSEWREQEIAIDVAIKKTDSEIAKLLKQYESEIGKEEVDRITKEVDQMEAWDEEKFEIALNEIAKVKESLKGAEGKEIVDDRQNIEVMEGGIEQGQEPVSGQLEQKRGEETIEDQARQAVAEGKSLEEFVKSKGKQIYHGTGEKFDVFDLEKMADGTVWFTDNKSKIEAGEVGASSKGEIMERIIDENNLNFGGWEEQDKYSVDELISKGYDGLKLEEDGEVTYQIFYPEKLQTKQQLTAAYEKAKASQPTDLDTQAQQAVADGKSLEEFVKSQGDIVYHATDRNFKEFSNEFLGRNTEGNATNDALLSTSYIGNWFSKESLLGRKDIPFGNQIEAVIPKELKEFSSLDEITDNIQPFLDDGFTPKEASSKFVAELKSKGYKGISVADEEFGGTSYSIFDPKQIKTKSQLTSAYEKAKASQPTDLDTQARQAVSDGKSLEEWVEGQKALYHGGYGVDALNEDIKILTPEEKLKFPSSGVGLVGLSTTTDKEYARQFSQNIAGRNDVAELYLSDTAKIKDIKGAIDDLSADEITKISKNFDVIKGTEENEYRILNPKVIKTKSQLTAAYEKAKAESTTTKNKTIPLELQPPEKKELFQETGELFNPKQFLKDINDAIGEAGQITPERTAKQEAARKRLVEQHLPALINEAKRVGKTLQKYLEDLGTYTKEQVDYLVELANKSLYQAKQVTMLDKQVTDKVIQKEKIYEGSILKKEPPTPTTLKDSRTGKIQLPAETLPEAFRRKVEDINLRLKKLNDAITEISGSVQDEEDIYMQKDMLPRVTNDAISRIRDEKRDLVVQMVKDGIEVEALDDYLLALHAKERNAKMNQVAQEKGEAPIDGLSGMTDAEADDILSKADPKFKKYVNMFKRMTDETLNYQVREGLLKSEHADIIRSTYKNYVPLYRDLEGDIGTGIGQGIDIKGKEVKRAKGSFKRVTSPIANIFYQKERTISRKLKNDIGKNIIMLAEKYPEMKGLFKVEQQTFSPVYDINGELQFMDPKFKFGDDVIGAKIDGKQYFITVKDALLARALKNTGLVKSGGLTRVMRAAVGLWSGMKTRFNPEFLLTNFERDLGEALVNIGVEKTALKGEGKNLRRDIVKGLFPSQRKILRHITGKEKNKTVSIFLELGGDTGHFYVENHMAAEKSLREIEKEIKGEGFEKLKNPLRYVGKVIENLNTMVELGVRFSAYEQLVKRGMSEKRAAQSAADLTVNFSRQGEISPYLKALYGFINPAIQGSSKVIRSISTREGKKMYSARVVKSIIALSALGFITRAISSAIDDEGDEQIPQWSKENKIVIADGRGGNIILWNLPYGYSSFYAMGSNIYEIMRKRITASEAFKNQFNAMVNSFSPFDTSLNSFIPTLARPLSEVTMNKNWYGAPIHPDQPFKNTPAPNSETYFKRVDSNALLVATMFNRLSGGKPGKAGLIDVYPNDLQYLFHQYVGGPVEFTASSVEAVARGLKGEFDPNKTPFVRKIYREGNARQWSNQIIYDTLDRAGKKEISEMEKDRFYRAIDTGLENELIEKKRANKNVQDFVKAIHNIEGAITVRENAVKILKMNKEDRIRLLKTYDDKTVKTIIRGGR